MLPCPSIAAADPWSQRALDMRRDPLRHEAGDIDAAADLARNQGGDCPD